MNIFNIKVIQQIITFLLNHGYVKGLSHLFKFFPNNWHNHEGFNFFHFSAKHHNIYFFELALYNQSDINFIDNHGNAPIHRFIESCFILINRNKTTASELITFEVNHELLHLFIKHGCDINQWIKHPERDGQWGEGVATFSRNNIIGSPIELLISLFWDKILSSLDFNDPDIIKLYQDTYQILSEAGAQINLIVNTGSFFDLANEYTQDAMQITDRIIVSHFFTKYLINENELEAITPLLLDHRVDFSLLDENSNSLLHHLFGRICSRYHILSSDKIRILLMKIIENPAFNQSHLYIENSFRLSAIKCLKRESAEYADYIEKILLNKKLQHSLTNEKNTIIKRQKI
jgi:hypothetical protein